MNAYFYASQLFLSSSFSPSIPSADIPSFSNYNFYC